MTRAPAETGSLNEPGPTRRRLLVGALAAPALTVSSGVLAGCGTSVSWGDGDRKPGPRTSRSPTPPPDPDLPILRRVADAERRLLARYAATARRHPELAERLRAYARHHEQHLAALPAEVSATPSASPSASSSRTPSGSPSRSSAPGASGTPSVTPAVPSSPAVALGALAEAERAENADREADLVRVTDPEHARLLASIGASERSHAVALAMETADDV